MKRIWVQVEMVLVQVRLTSIRNDIKLLQNASINLHLYLDTEAVDREAEAIKIDELNVAQINEIRDKVDINFNGHRNRNRYRCESSINYIRCQVASNR